MYRGFWSTSFGNWLSHTKLSKWQDQPGIMKVGAWVEQRMPISTNVGMDWEKPAPPKRYELYIIPTCDVKIMVYRCGEWRPCERTPSRTEKTGPAQKVPSFDRINREFHMWWMGWTMDGRRNEWRVGPTGRGSYRAIIHDCQAVQFLVLFHLTARPTYSKTNHIFNWANKSLSNFISRPELHNVHLIAYNIRSSINA